MIARDIYEVLFCNDVNFWEATKDLYKKLDNKKLHKLFKRLYKTEAKILKLQEKFNNSTGNKRKKARRQLCFKRSLKRRLERYIMLYFINN